MKNSKVIFNYASLIVILALIISCEKRDFKIIAKIETENVSNVTAKQARISGLIIDAGNGLSDYGHCWSEKTIPSTSDFKTSFGNAQVGGEYISDLKNLQPGITYYVRAYGIFGKETIYGKEASFTTMDGKAILTTSGVTNISLFTAKGGGDVTSAGGDEVLGKGICWDTLNTVTLRKKAGYTQHDTGLGAFTSDLTNLKRGKTYFVKAWARTNVDTTYGEFKSFVTLTGIPIITTKGIKNISANSASSGGDISYDGGAPIISRGICWNITPNATIANFFTNDGSGIGSFESNLYGMKVGITYYIRAYASNQVTTSYGNQLSFTASDLATLTTSGISQITASGATIGGNITNDGGTPIIARGVCWSTSEMPTISHSKTIDGTNIGSYTSTLDRLTFSTIYYVRAYATNSAGTAYGNQVSLTTLPLSLGGMYAGGFVFYIDGTAQHGLVAAPYDQSTGAEWGCVGTALSGCNNQYVGYGLINTIAIISQCSTPNTAARICYNLVLNDYDDWFLPSRNELMLMHSNLYSKNIGNFNSSTYWSSDQSDNYTSQFGNGTRTNHGYDMNFGNGWSVSTYKNVLSRVRAARAF